LAANLTIAGGDISSVTVSLDITGGFNGDLINNPLKISCL
jgi:hypothetical protein